MSDPVVILTIPTPPNAYPVITHDDIDRIWQIAAPVADQMTLNDLADYVWNAWPGSPPPRDQIVDTLALGQPSGQQVQIESTGLPTPVDWPTFWKRDRSADDWIIPQIVPAGRLVTLWAKRKTGKSLLTLDIAASAATGRPVLGQPAGPPIDVIYCDMEMTEDDLEERLVDLGYGPADDLSHFHYYLLPTLPPLDDYAGGQALLALVQRHQAQLVVIDTMARAVAGEENSADTYRRFYRATGMLLKQAGVAAMRLDHAGKETDRGERGSSAKGDDVDLSWELRDAGGNEYLLKRSYTRISWVPEQLKLRREIEPLRHVISHDTWPAGTKPCADHLDRLEIPIDATVNNAVTALREADLVPRSKQIVAAAQRWRRHPDHLRTAPEPSPEPPSTNTNGTAH